jgi:hypothetical protein
MGTLRHLRERIATYLAARRGKPKGKDRAVCEGIRIPSELLQAWTVRHLRKRTAEHIRVKWETSKAGWSWGCVAALDSRGRTIWIADAHRGDGKALRCAGG